MQERAQLDLVNIRNEVLFKAAVLDNDAADIKRLLSLNYPPADVREVVNLFEAFRANKRLIDVDWKMSKNGFLKKIQNMSDIDIDNLT